MTTNSHGWTTAEALRNGEREQFAIVIDGVTHTVEIVNDPVHGFTVLHRRTWPSEFENDPYWQQRVAAFGTNLPAAREEFRRIAKPLGARI